MSKINLPEKISFYASPAHECNYLPDQQAITVFADPELPKNKAIYSFLSKHGFRRSGEFIYHPECEKCNACIATRLPVKLFQLNRNQKRTWKQNQDLIISQVTADFQTEHFQLYQRYLSTRHAGGGMDNPTPENYMQFLTCGWSETFFLEFRLNSQLVAIAVVDKLEDGLSAVYSFYDPDLQKRSLGRFTILFEIEYARQAGLEWLYLGYWIENCQKMKYKQEYQPQEQFLGEHWHLTTSSNDR